MSHKEQRPNNVMTDAITIYLPDVIQKALSEIKNTDITPFENDWDYYQSLEAIEILRYSVHTLKNAAKAQVFSISSSMYAFPTSIVLQNGSQVSAILETHLKILEERKASRLEKSKELKMLMPRFERLLDRLNATSFQRKSFSYCFILRTSSNTIQTKSSLGLGRYSGLRGGSEGIATSVNEIAMIFDLNPGAVIEAFTNDVWSKETLIKAPQSRYDDIYNASEVINEVIMGFPITFERYQTIESQLVQALLSEEPDFHKTAVGKVKAKLNDAKPTSLGELPPMPEGGLMLVRTRSGEGKKNTDLYSILKQEELREKKGKEKTKIKELEDDKDGKFKEVDKEASEDRETEEKEIQEHTDGLIKYSSDLEYLQDQFLLNSVLRKIAEVKQIEESTALDEDDEGQKSRGYHDPYSDESYDPITGRKLNKDLLASKRQNTLKKYERKRDNLVQKIENRLILTKKADLWLPRFERLATALNLEMFEKFVILYLIEQIIKPSGGGHIRGGGKVTVQTLLSLFSNNLKDRVKYRKFFYKSATLIREGILILNGFDMASFLLDLTQTSVELDRRMMDFIVGLDTEFGEIIDGSNLYSPDVSFEDVILPEDIIELVFETVSNFDKLKTAIVDLEVDKTFTYGRGQCLLFYGASGTGKTMLANAIATKLRKKVLLVNFPNLGDNSAGAILKLIFRESKIHNAILFFDECESLFQTRERGNHNVNTVLTELERHDGLSILATNRAHELDEAMYRRINLAIEFKKPDHLLREKIWRKLHPAKLLLADDVNIAELALKFELSGGFIKNIWLMALGFAVSRGNIPLIITHEDLKKASAHQLRGRLSMVDFDRRIVPTRGLEDCQLSEKLKTTCEEIVNYVKAESILFSQWGFQKQHGTSKGITALFCGPPGVGKTMAAEGIGYDLGRPLKIVNCSELVSKWVGETGKNIQSVFDEAKSVDAVLVFDEAEGLFGERNEGGGKHDVMNVGLLLHHLETFSGVCIVITNLRSQIDKAFFRRFKFVLEFTLPDAYAREKIFRLLVPPQCPISNDVDFKELAKKFSLSGGGIKSVVFRCATRCALRIGEKRVITMGDLERSCKEVMDADCCNEVDGIDHVDNSSTWRVFNENATGVSLVLKRLYNNIDRNALVKYPATKISRRSSFDACSSSFIPGGAKITANDPREKKIKDINLKVPKFNRRNSTGSINNLISNIRPSKKTFDSIMQDLNERKRLAREYRPPLHNAFTNEVEKQKLQYLNAFNGGKALPDELTRGQGNYGSLSMPLSIMHPDQAYRDQRRTDFVDNEETTVVSPIAMTNEEKKFKKECQDLFEKIQIEIEERKDFLDEMEKRGQFNHKNKIEREIKERIEELRKLDKLLTD